MAKVEDAQFRSTLMSERIRERTDVALRELISNFESPLSFRPLDDLMISVQAWNHITSAGMGSNHFRVDMPRYIDFYLDGRLKLDEHYCEWFRNA